MRKTDSIELSHFSNKDLEVLNSFELPKEQEQFTLLPTNLKEVTENQYRIVVQNDTEPVGFFLLNSTNQVKDYTDNPKAMLLTSLSINHVKQGRGYAKQAMFLLRKFVVAEFPNCNEIIFVVNS